MKDMGKDSLGENSILDGRYRILSARRETPDGFLYSAENILTGETVAVKEFFPQKYVVRDGERAAARSEKSGEVFGILCARFLKEARVLRDFGDLPGIVQIVDYFSGNDTVYCAMKPEEGRLLAEQVAVNGRMDGDTAFKAAIPVLTALGRIHEAGFLFRGIRPDTVCVTPKNTFQICDFGVPGEIGNRAVRSEITVEDVLAGTEGMDTGNKMRVSTRIAPAEADAYTPPERMEEDARQGAWSDLYSLAGTLYFAVTGKIPADVYSRLLGESLVLPSEMDIRIRPGLEKVLSRALSVRAEERYQSAGEMLAEIREVFPAEAGRKEKRKKRRKIAAVVFACALCTAGIAGIYLYFHPERLLFSGQETEYVRIYPPDGVDASDLADDWKIIRARVSALAGDAGYVWKKKGGSVLVILPDSLFEETGSRNLIENELTDPWEFKVYDEWQDGFVGYRDTLKMQVSSAEVMKGSIPGLEEFLDRRGFPADDLLRAASHDENYYVRLQIDADGYAQLAQSVSHTTVENKDGNGKSYGKNAFTLLMNAKTDYAGRLAEEQKYFDTLYQSIPVRLEGDGEHIDIACVPGSAAYARAMAWNLTHADPEHTFTCTAEQTVNWEDPDKSPDTGVYQKDADTEISNAVLLTYLPAGGSFSEPISRGEWYRAYVQFKERLDVLKTPYVIGIAADNSEEIIVRISRQSIPEFYAMHIGEKSDPGAAVGWSDLNIYYLAVGLCRKDDGTYGMTLKNTEDMENEFVRKGWEQDVGAPLSAAEKNGADCVSLLMGDDTLAVGSASEQPDLDKGILYFPDIVLDGWDPKYADTVRSCLDAMNDWNYSDSAAYYDLIGVMSADRKGRPMEKQEDLVCGFPGISEEDRSYISRLAEKNDLTVSFPRNGDYRYLSFSKHEEENAAYETADASEEIDAFMDGSLETAEKVLTGLMQNTSLFQHYLRNIELRFYGPGGEYSLDIIMTAKGDSAASWYGQRKITGTVNDLSGTGTRERVPLENAAGKRNAPAWLQAFAERLDTTPFFRQYGGSTDWEYYGTMEDWK